MADQNKGWNDVNQTPEQGEYTPSVATEFLRQTIKQKPINKKKLLRRTLTTMIMAVVFGLVACLTFLILQPVINSWLNPEKKAEQIAFPEDTTEVAIEEFYIDDDQMKEEEREGIKESTVHDNEQKVQELLKNMTLDVSDYEMMYAAVRDYSKELEKSVVTITGVTNDVDWFNNTYSNERQASGVVVASNGRALLIAVKDIDFENAENILVEFYNGAQINGEYMGKDPYTDIAVVSAPYAQMDSTTRGTVPIIKLGTSNGISMRGTPVIALGSPSGSVGSVSYGMITSDGSRMDFVDSDYKLLTTDIYGSTTATGILVTLKGYVVGIIDNSYNSDDTENLLSAIGISELKKVIEKISNREARTYLGIHGIDVPISVRQEMNMPKGVYISGVEMNSPAMAAGIQTGDIIASVGDTPIQNYKELLSIINEVLPDTTMTMTLMRQAGEEYAEIEAEVTLDSLER